LLKASVSLAGDNGIEGNWLLYYRPVTKIVEEVTNLEHMSTIIRKDLVNGAKSTLPTAVSSEEVIDLATEDTNLNYANRTAPISFLKEFGLTEWPMTTGYWSLYCDKCQVGGIRPWPVNLPNLFTRSESGGRNCPSFQELQGQYSLDWWDTETVGACSDVFRHFDYCRGDKVWNPSSARFGTRKYFWYQCECVPVIG
jgi:hypothetical protein